MGCGCGGGRSKKSINVINNQNKGIRSMKLSCPKCNVGIMLLSQSYSPKDKRYIKNWKCNKCGHNMIGK